MDPTRKIIRRMLSEDRGVFQQIGDGSISAPPPGCSDRGYPRDLFERLLNEAEPPAVKGEPRTVQIKSLYAWGPKVVQTLGEIEQEELSYHEEDVPLLVSKLSRRGAWFVLDGHHRAIEAIQRGDSTILVQQSADVPNIEHGYRDMLSAMVNIVDAVAPNRGEPQ